jgi:hypothetical protein
MGIYRMLRDSTFGPREVSKMTTAYEIVLIELGIDRADPRTEPDSPELTSMTCKVYKTGNERSW